MPPVDLIERISGWREPWLFDAQGRATRADWERALNAIGASIADFTRVLDYGCGPGRVLRHMRDLTPEIALMGADTDHEAIDWCSANIAWAEFRAVDPMPPMAMPESSFDLVLGHSVFTHMPEDVQDAWLEDICRMLRPRGIALLTVNGEHAMA